MLNITQINKDYLKNLQFVHDALWKLKMLKILSMIGMKYYTYFKTFTLDH